MFIENVITHKMSVSDDIDHVDPNDVTLVECILGYDIRVDGERVGSIEGILGELEYLVVEPHCQDKGIARAALNEFVSLSRLNGFSEVTTNNAIHPAMEHILETEGFERQSDEIGWMKEIC